jgi:hypothetical protein
LQNVSHLLVVHDESLGSQHDESFLGPSVHLQLPLMQSYFCVHVCELDDDDDDISGPQAAKVNETAKAISTLRSMSSS